MIGMYVLFSQQLQKICLRLVPFNLLGECAPFDLDRRFFAQVTNKMGPADQEFDMGEARGADDLLSIWQCLQERFPLRGRI